MVPAKQIVQTLADNFDFVEALARKSKNSPNLNRDEIFRTAIAVYKQNRDEAQKAFNILLKRGILRQIDQEDAFILQKYTQDYVLNLVQEHELGLAEIVKVEVEKVRSISEEIQKALDDCDLSQLRFKTNSLMHFLSDIGVHLQTDAAAIRNIIDKAKTFPPETPLNIRYKEVLECFDQYVEPMTQLLESGANNFQELTYSIEQQLRMGLELCRIQNGLISDQQTLQGAIVQIHLLVAQIQDNLELFSKELSPLRSDVLKNNRISKAVTSILSNVRKKGMRRSISIAHFKLGGLKKNMRMSTGPATREYAGRVMNYQPNSVLFPEALDSTESDIQILRVEEVLDALNKYKGKAPLMNWLKEAFYNHSERNLLMVYHQLLQLIPERFSQSEIESSVDLVEHRMRYYPHIVEGEQ